ncbi:MAG: polyprenol monophosphomannose synthase [Candidatus Bathyarchaeia archaeon]|jgi:dolichol-phosphate mannosyltransferase
MISIVLGTYNESENISKLIPILEDIFQTQKIDGEIVVVDDNSPDGTGNVVLELGAKYGNVKLFSRPQKLGHGSAIAEGYRHAMGEIIVSMDTDFSHDPYDIPRFITKINEGYDLVLASRYIPDGSYEVKSFQTLKKSLVSRIGNILVRVILRVPAHDFTTSFRAMRRRVIENVTTETPGNSFFMEFIVKAYRSKFMIAEIPIVFKDRVSGKSKLKLGKQSFVMLKELLKLALS